MNWRIKSLAHWIISTCPAQTSLRYWAQRHLTGSLPRSMEAIVGGLARVQEHLSSLEKFGPVDLSEGTFYEFGAGWDLFSPLAFYAFGINNQLVVDIWPFINTNLLNVTISGLRKQDKVYLPRKLPDLDTTISPVRSLEKNFGIVYRAPVDARDTGLDNQSVDFITSTLTMEHIPRQDLLAICKECIRIIKPGGVLSFIIDYQDHYSYFDSTISVYNFLKYTEKWWKIYNPPSHYQNRLRHSEYKSIFQDSGLRIVDCKTVEPTEEDISIIQSIDFVSDKFDVLTPQELGIRRAHFVLQPHTKNV
jgi:SAM-dependent methyltransferase